MESSGMTVKEVAEALKCTPQTIHNHLNKMDLGDHITKRGRGFVLDSYAVKAVAESLDKKVPPELLGAEEEPEDPEKLRLQEEIERLREDLSRAREDLQKARREIDSLREANRKNVDLINEQGGRLMDLTGRLGALQEAFLLYRDIAKKMLEASLFERIRKFPRIRKELPEIPAGEQDQEN